jgi:lysophospholipase L1-like esterase
VTATQPDVQQTPKIPCRGPRDLVQLDQPLTRTAVALAAGDPLVIVAIGSSSTWGAGATSQAYSYPARLEAELRAHFPGTAITVLNRGAGGEDAKQMLTRFDDMVIKERPDLVIWQVGTNAVLRDQNIDGEAPLITEGIRRLKASHADVVLMDPQYAPKVIAKPDAERMVDLIGRATRDAKIGVFHRFAIMRDWVNQGATFETLFSNDGLHMNDWSYACVAKLLGNSIVDAVRRPSVARARAPQ